MAEFFISPAMKGPLQACVGDVLAQTVEGKVKVSQASEISNLGQGAG
jgi:hypothetical protein